MWGGIVFGLGMALIALEFYMASQKKGGVDATDKKRIIGIFWTVLMMTGGVMLFIKFW